MADAEHGISRRHVAVAAPRASAPLALLVVCSAMPAAAQRIENSVAVFAALDKVTAKISRLEVPLNQTANFGALKMTPRACYTRAPTEPPKTTTFVEVDEVLLDGKEKRIFSGWMFADSPGLNAVEHPVFDVWLTDCAQPRAAAQRAAAGRRPARRRARAPARGPRPAAPPPRPAVKAQAIAAPTFASCLRTEQTCVIRSRLLQLAIAVGAFASCMARRLASRAPFADVRSNRRAVVCRLRWDLGEGSTGFAWRWEITESIAANSSSLGCRRHAQRPPLPHRMS